MARKCILFKHISLYYIDETFGIEDGKIRGYDGHQEIELALLRLYEVTNKQRYLNLSRYFLEERGKDNPHFYHVEYEKRNRTIHWGTGMMDCAELRPVYIL